MTAPTEYGRRPSPSPSPSPDPGPAGEPGRGSGGRHRAPDDLPDPADEQPGDERQRSHWDPWANDPTPAPVSPTVANERAETAVIPSVAQPPPAPPVAPSPPAPPRPQPRPPHPAPDPNGTAVLPKTPPAGPAPQTQPLPAQPHRTDETSLMGIVPPAPEPSDDDDQPSRPEPRPGEQVVQLRAERTQPGGYRSIYSALTRTTLGTAVRTTVRGLGEVLIALGAIVLLLFVYQVWGKSAVVASHQDDLDQQLEQQWAADPAPAATESPEPEAEEPEPLGPPPGHAIARMYIPAIGSHWVVVEGVALEDIRYAPGRYPSGAMPGEVGNFAIAGHRNPATFWDLDQVHEGAAIVVETQNTWYIYSVTRNHIVEPDQVEVVAPVPGEPEAEPTRAMLTLTTCNPKWDNYERLVVHAELIDQQPREGDHRPDVLGGLGG